MASREVTTAVVVDFPTPFAPPVVHKPQLQPIMAISSQKITAFTMAAIKSQTCRKLWAELRKTTGEIRYKVSATKIPPANPVKREMAVKRGSIKVQAMTRGITR